MDYQKLYQNAPRLRDLKANPKWNDTLEFAKSVWIEETMQEWKRSGDRGACTLGGGVQVLAKKDRCRKPDFITIISPPVSVQGEVPKFAGMKSAKEIIETEFPELKPYLKTHYGFMD